MDDLISVSTAARKLKVHRQQVYRWIDDGRVPFQRVAGKPFVFRDIRRPKPLKRGPKTANSA
jgi:excisionase family DNA binding protein